MKYLPLAIVLAFFFSCSNTDHSENEETAADAIEEPQPFPVEKKFPELTRFFQMQDPAFSTARFEREEVETTDTAQVLAIDTARLGPYQPFLIYNADRSMAIDPVSYNYVVRKLKDTTLLAEGGPDVEIGLLDFRNNKRKQLYFSGTMTSFLEAKWEGPNTVLFALAMEVAPDKIQPVIWEYNTQTGARAVYNYQGTVEATPGNYATVMLGRRSRLEPAAPPKEP